MSQPVTYAPGATIVAFMGHILTGFADEICKVKRTSDVFETVVGADGEVARRQSADKSGEISITVKQTSDANATLQAILARDELLVTPQVGPISIADNNGNVLWSGEAWIKGYPELTRSKDITDATWVFSCAELVYELAEQPSVA